MIVAPIQDSKLNTHLDSLPKDEMLVFVMANGRIRGALFHGTRFVNQMRAQHRLGILETMVLGQASLCGALLLPTMKGREHITWRHEVNGPAQGFSVEADSQGFVRSYLFTDTIPVAEPLKNWDLAPFLGTGTMTMTTLHAGDKFPRVSSVEAKNKNIAQDLAWYFSQSEQIQTAFNTGIQLDSEGRVVGAGGLFLQMLPLTGGTKAREPQAANADEGLIERMEHIFATLPSLGKYCSKGRHLEELLNSIFSEFEPSVALRRSVRYDCPCSKETYLTYIRSLPVDEVTDMKLHGPNPLHITCRNCGSEYLIPVDEL